MDKTLIGMLKNDDMGKLILRLTMGVLMLLHGIAKISSPASLEYIAGQLANIGLPGFIAYAVFLGELVAPLLLIGGVYCRVAALLIVGNMLFAIGLVHSGELFSLAKNGGWALELQGFYLFGAVSIIFLGSGRYALRPE